MNKIVKTLGILSVLLLMTNVSYASLETDAKLQYNKGIDYYNLGQYDDAISSFKEAINLDPNYINAYYNLGSILQYLNQDEEAINTLNQIVLRRPDDYETVYKLVQLYKKTGDYEKMKTYTMLIPKDTILGSNARRLIADMGLPTKEVKVTQNPAITQSSFSIANPAADSDGMYKDIKSPTGIATDINGNVYIAGFSDNTIYKITPDNKKIVYIKSEKIDGPIGLVIDKNQNMYIANYNKNNVLKVDQDGAITVFVENIANPYCLTLTDDLLFVSSQGSQTVVRKKLTK